MKTVIALALLFLATAVPAATIVAGSGPASGARLALSAADFAARGPCGSGLSVVDDGCAVVLADGTSKPAAHGRYDALGGPWIDSQDLSKVAWTVSHHRPFASLTFALTDAFDQNAADGLGASFFRLTAGDATWSIDGQEENGALHWLTVRFDAPVTTARLDFSTRLNDAWGVASASFELAPIPLPPAAPLLALGLGALATLGHRRPRPAREAAAPA
ncbi:hypothetical protein [Rubellimicrobium roseum]|uniref:PEP-CTERM sorting domain-containing protein n=1 Tax=Rubellimicrobium roseum TaxID=687525 RepID=A0A5C4NMY2_9RHOB|nr:hypothetical protein [Rubellimicrobium roseum]TNC74808.1 hypothetical protein FHG71_01365 [Rubellimicrobium roseum]